MNAMTMTIGEIHYTTAITMLRVQIPRVITRAHVTLGTVHPLVTQKAPSAQVGPLYFPTTWSADLLYFIISLHHVIDVLHQFLGLAIERYILHMGCLATVPQILI